MLLGAALIGVVSLRGTSLGDRDFYYDESERRLFVAPASRRPPIDGVGGAKRDGVRAIVGVCGPDAERPDEADILYLQRFTPELIALLEQNDRAAAAGEPGPPEVQDRIFLSEHTLVRRPDPARGSEPHLDPDGAEWHPIGSPEGQEIIAAVRRPCPDGSHPRLVTPDD